MDILVAMDSLLSGLEESGHRAKSWLIREEDWQTVSERLANGDVPDAFAVGEMSYRGIPVEFGSASPDAIAAVLADGGELTVVERGS